MSDQQGLPLHLRPLDFGEIIDHSFKLYFRNFPVLFTLAAVIHIPVLLLQVPLARAGLLGDGGNIDPELFTNPAVAISLLVGLVVTLLLYLLVVQPLLTGAVVHVASRSFLGGKSTLREAATAALRRAWVLMGTACLLLLGGTVALAAVMLVLAVLAEVGGPAGAVLMVLGVLGLICGVIAVVVYAYLTNPVVMMEPTRFVGAVVRSFRLVSGHFWRMLGLGVVLVLITGLVKIVLNVPLGIAVALIPSQVGEVVGLVVGGLIEVVMAPITVLGATLAYYDLRMRKEGFDLEAMAAWLSGQGGE